MFINHAFWLIATSRKERLDVKYGFSFVARVTPP